MQLALFGGVNGSDDIIVTSSMKELIKKIESLWRKLMSMKTQSSPSPQAFKPRIKRGNKSTPRKKCQRISFDSGTLRKNAINERDERSTLASNNASETKRARIEALQLFIVAVSEASNQYLFADAKRTHSSSATIVRCGDRQCKMYSAHILALLNVFFSPSYASWLATFSAPKFVQ